MFFFGSYNMCTLHMRKSLLGTQFYCFFLFYDYHLHFNCNIKLHFFMLVEWLFFLLGEWLFFFTNDAAVFVCFRYLLTMSSTYFVGCCHNQSWRTDGRTYNQNSRWKKPSKLQHTTWKQKLLHPLRRKITTIPTEKIIRRKIHVWPEDNPEGPKQVDMND